jgi:hypothetical protein
LLLLALMALIAGELILSGVIARQRFGSDAIAETTEDWMEQARSVAMTGRPSPLSLPNETPVERRAELNVPLQA